MYKPTTKNGNKKPSVAQKFQRFAPLTVNQSSFIISFVAFYPFSCTVVVNTGPTFHFVKKLTSAWPLSFPDAHLLLLSLTFSPLSPLSILIFQHGGSCGEHKTSVRTILAAPLEKNKRNNIDAKQECTKQRHKVQNRDQKLLTKFHSPSFLFIFTASFRVCSSRLCPSSAFYQR